MGKDNNAKAVELFGPLLFSSICTAWFLLCCAIFTFRQLHPGAGPTASELAFVTTPLSLLFGLSLWLSGVVFGRWLDATRSLFPQVVLAYLGLSLLGVLLSSVATVAIKSSSGYDLFAKGNGGLAFALVFERIRAEFILSGVALFALQAAFVAEKIASRVCYLFLTLLASLVSIATVFN
jgi:hypothetical protein